MTIKNEVVLEYSLSNIKLIKKPTNYSKIHRSLSTKQDTLRNFSKQIEHGYSFSCVSFLNNSRKNINFKQAQLIGLDFDNNEAYKDVIKLLNEYNLHVNIYYRTFSWKEHFHKFRIILFLEKPITDPLVYKNICVALVQLTSCDRTCSDIAKMYLPGSCVEVFSYTANSILDLTLLVEKFNIKNKKVKAQANIRKHFKKANIFDNKKLETKLIRNFDYEIIKQKSPIFKSFSEGKIHLKYIQLRVLISNLQYVKGGLLFIHDRMVQHGSYKQQDFDLLRNIPRYNYAPNHLAEFDPAVKEYKSFFSFHKTELTSLIEKKEDLRVGEMELLKNISQILTEEPEPVLLKATTGLGKTESLILSLQTNKLQTNKKILVALPTHKLKTEVSSRLQKIKIDHVSQPVFPELQTQWIKSYFNDLTTLYGNSWAFIQTISHLKKELLSNWEDCDYISLIEYAKKSNQFCSKKQVKDNNLFLMTHNKLISMLSKNQLKIENLDRVVFDEDPLNVFLPIYKLNFSEYAEFYQDAMLVVQQNLQKQKPIAADILVLNNFFLYLRDRPNIIAENFPVFVDSSKLQLQIEKLKYGHLINQLLSSDFILYSLFDNNFYGIKKQIPQNLINKTSILSATIDRFFYEHLFQNHKMNYVEVPNIKNTQKIYQYTDNAFFKSFFKRNKNPSKYPDVTNTQVITYKEFKHRFPKENVNELHFGNLEGLNTLENQNLTIIGTPIPNVISSYLYAKALQLPFHDTRKAYRWVQVDNFKFKVYTFMDENLAQIELRVARAKLEQAVGRARAIRNNVSVTIYSKIPCRYTDVFSNSKDSKTI